MAPGLKIRGIYTTALTRFFLDSGYEIVDPSPEIQERFGLRQTRGLPKIFIQDREDLQGIHIFGEAELVSLLVRLLQERFLDAALLECKSGEESPEELTGELQESRDLARAHLEFAGASKQTLDEIRCSVIPTLTRHHRLGIIHPKKLERAEKKLSESPGKKKELEKEIFLEAILLPLKKSGWVRLEHIKPLGKPIRPREGVLLEGDERKILVKRFFSQGRYDGLGLPIEEGDYGITEAQEGAWYVKHAYYSAAGKPKGEYYNINTPVELYPYGARYVDLEIDVIRRGEGEPFLVDRDALAILSKTGRIGAGLEKKAIEVTEKLIKGLGSRVGNKQPK
jgi:hypothetical protein